VLLLDLLELVHERFVAFLEELLVVGHDVEGGLQLLDLIVFVLAALLELLDLVNKFL